MKEHETKVAPVEEKATEPNDDNISKVGYFCVYFLRTNHEILLSSHVSQR